MPSIRKRVSGFIRGTFSPSQSVDVEEESDPDSPETAFPPTPRPQPPPQPPAQPPEQSFIRQYLNGSLKRPRGPQIYYGKTGVDLPSLKLEPLKQKVVAAYTGPDGGLTEVPFVRKRPIASIANLDDELNISFDGDSRRFDDAQPSTSSAYAYAMDESIFNMSIPDCLQQQQLMADCADHPSTSHSAAVVDWSNFNEDFAYGTSASLYEFHPLTRQRAGEPVADVFGVLAKDGHCIMALADGVNWGEGARLAARCAVRAVIDHLHQHLDSSISTTTDVFHGLLGALSAGQALILQEGGQLTTLCVAVVARLARSAASVVCACNVGDSLAFVYSPTIGVREVTLGSHDIGQMRDMRDAGGALGPVDGVNPELQNLTCSMTTVDEGDIVFITSDGVSDNFDPVVGKFCVAPKSSVAIFHRDNDALTKTQNDLSEPLPSSPQQRVESSLPVVEAHQRHELMLLRMDDLLTNGVTLGDTAATTARHLCDNLVRFATQLTMAKRRIIEDPDLYIGEQNLNLHDQRRLRRKIRQRLTEMPGKLDHATVVAYRVGAREANLDNFAHPLPNGESMQIHTLTQDQGDPDVTPLPMRKEIVVNSLELAENGLLPTNPETELPNATNNSNCLGTDNDTDFAPLVSSEQCSPSCDQTPSADRDMVNGVEVAFGDVRMIDELSKSSSLHSQDLLPIQADDDTMEGISDMHSTFRQGPPTEPTETCITESDAFYCDSKDFSSAELPEQNDMVGLSLGEKELNDGLELSACDAILEECAENVDLSFESNIDAEASWRLQRNRETDIETDNYPDQSVTSGSSHPSHFLPTSSRYQQPVMMNSSYYQATRGHQQAPYIPTILPENQSPSHDREASGKVLTASASTKRTKKKHPRGSPARHTLSVDIGWIRRLVPQRNNESRSSLNSSGNDERGSSPQRSPKHGRFGWKGRLLSLGRPRDLTDQPISDADEPVLTRSGSWQKPVPASSTETGYAPIGSQESGITSPKRIQTEV